MLRICNAIRHPANRASLHTVRGSPRQSMAVESEVVVEPTLVRVLSNFVARVRAASIAIARASSMKQLASTWGDANVASYYFWT